MLISIDAEKVDTLPDCLARATAIATLLQINVLFYYDREGYFCKPGFTPADVLAEKQKKA